MCARPTQGWSHLLGEHLNYYEEEQQPPNQAANLSRPRIALFAAESTGNEKMVGWATASAECKLSLTEAARTSVVEDPLLEKYRDRSLSQL